MQAESQKVSGKIPAGKAEPLPQCPVRFQPHYWHLRNLKVHKSTEPGEMHKWVPRELAEEVSKSLLYLRSCGSVVNFSWTGKWKT